MALQYKNVEDASRIYLLPNLFTAANMFFGFLSIIRCIQARYSVQEDWLIHRYYNQAVWLILLSGISDALDGRMARFKKKESMFGLEFDSICDLVSFGMAPALMAFLLILSPTDNWPFFRQVGWLFGFIYLLCAGIRLARFNVITSPLLPKKEDNSHDFVGLPVPAAAGMVASLVLIVNNYDLSKFSFLLLPPLMLCTAFLMVSTIRFPSFKKLDWNARTQLNSFIIITLGLITIMWFHEISCFLIFFTYITFGVVRHLKWRRYRNSRN